MKNSVLKKEIKFSHSIKFFEYLSTKSLKKDMQIYNLANNPIECPHSLKDYKKLEKDLV